MMRAITTFALLVFATSSAYAIPKPKPYPYSERVKKITEGQKEIPKNPVYIGPAVKAPGGYEIKPGMTIADLVGLAGGLNVGDLKSMKRRSKVLPISIFRPTKNKPDPDLPIFSCMLDERKQPAYGLADCTQQVWASDVVYIVAGSTKTQPWILP